jgi:hypothetical protein
LVVCKYDFVIIGNMSDDYPTGFLDEDLHEISNDYGNPFDDGELHAIMNFNERQWKRNELDPLGLDAPAERAPWLNKNWNKGQGWRRREYKRGPRDHRSAYQKMMDDQRDRRKSQQKRNRLLASMKRRHEEKARLENAKDLAVKQTDSMSPFRYGRGGARLWWNHWEKYDYWRAVYRDGREPWPGVDGYLPYGRMYELGLVNAKPPWGPVNWRRRTPSPEWSPHR